MLGFGSLASAQIPEFVPPRLVQGSLPAQPAPNVVSGGDVWIEFVVDRTGVATRPVVLRSTPPYTQLVVESVTRWRFNPARMRDEKKNEVSVDSPVVIAAMYRPPAIYDNPTLGEPSKDLNTPSRDVAIPTFTASPTYPIQAVVPGGVLYEVTLNAAGTLTESRVIASDPGFVAAAGEALAKWRFRAAYYRSRPAPATTYVFFGFRLPLVPGVSPTQSCGLPPLKPCEPLPLQAAPRP
jgi:outer membrane biosynthesis protein TonB